MLSSGIQGYEFGPYRIDAGERLLRRGDELVSLPPKVVATLLVLVQNAGRMVDKNDLLKAVWPDTFVEEGALTRNISLLRKALGDLGEEPAFIETIPKRGYRFVAPVRAAAGPETAVAEATPATPSASEPHAERRKWRIGRVGVLVAVLFLTLALIAWYFAGNRIEKVAIPPTSSGNAVAVLPFRSIEKDATQDYFADGITQALISSLAKIQKLRIVSLASDTGGRTDSAAWASLIREGALHRLLTGTVHRSGGHIRIDAQLLDPGTRAVCWARSYERESRDVLALESEVAEAIVGEILAGITTEERDRLRQRATVKPEALDAYLQGRYFWNRRTEDGLKRAIQCFRQAIAADPNYAPAYSGLADSYSLLGSIGYDVMRPKEAMPLAKDAAQKAIQLDPDLADAHVSLASVHLSYDWDLSAAQREFSRALALNPNSATGRHWYSHFLMAAGDLPGAMEQMQEALRLEPLSPSINIGIGWCLYYARRYPEAIERFRSVTENDPTLPLAHQTLGMAFQQVGQFDKAIEEFNRAAAFSNNSPAAVASLASAYAAAGKVPQARAELSRLEEIARTRYVPPFYYAMIYHALGDITKTLQWGLRAVDERCDYLMYLRVEPRVGRLAGNPEFLRVMARLGKK